MYRQAENVNYMEVEIPVDSTDKTLPNLVKFVNYEFLLKAFNSVGKGPASTPVTVFVGEAGTFCYFIVGCLKKIRFYGEVYLLYVFILSFV
jgi:hypothetical protein